MRQQIIELLTYPRLAMFDRIQADGCPHGAHFQDDRQMCRECAFGPECDWLSGTDVFTGLAQRPVEDLMLALRFAVDYVDTTCTRAGHNRRACVCSACTWLRDARDLVKTANC